MQGGVKMNKVQNEEDEEDQKHRREVHLSIISDLIHEGIEEETAKKVCSLLAQDVIGHVKIVY